LVRASRGPQPAEADTSHFVRGKSQGQPGYDERADFNLENKVNVLDLNILKSNYGKVGDQ
jgi:hypothetical protein